MKSYIVELQLATTAHIAEILATTVQADIMKVCG